jgi:amino acid permease
MSELQNDLSFKKEADSAAQSADVESGNSVVVESTAIKPLQRGLNARHITIISFGYALSGRFLAMLRSAAD